MKKSLALGLIVLLTTGLISGCGNGGSKQEATPASPQLEASKTPSETSKEPVTLRFSWWGGDERNEATLKVIEKFEAEYPHITIEPEFGGSDGYQEKLSTSLAGNAAADIIQNGTGWMPDFVSRGDFFIDFNTYKEQIDLSGFDAQYLENVGTFDGKLLGLPTGIAGPTFLINKTLATKIGLEVPQDLTWEDLITLGKKVKEYDNNLYLLNMDSSTLKTHVLRPYILQLTGTPFIDDEAKVPSFTNEQLLQVMDYIKALYDNNVVQPASESASFKDAVQTNPKWIAGEFVGILTDSSRVDVMTSANTEVEYMIASMPQLQDKKNDGYYANPPQLMCINKASKHIEEAVLFLDYFYNNAEAAEILKDLRSVPPTAQAREICEEKALISPLVKEAVDKALELNGTNEMGLTTDGEIEAVMDDMIESVIYGKTGTVEAVDNAVKMFTHVLSDK
ncbi:capsular biosynthesis protein [Sporanaerobium hydrogeniformans]|uniref:Capsular biosynthesis protein n=1 Tax=Sporanaerobium hydrogeniformans TaxID=3072179 RepID=A0AC61DFJ5_9FIRM|nr:ABC transporter substrate-binding protein [Sporanaerobium hydrogeniformans]PHV71608.1 capsular biosynthesis protein [Sporanaerobium hydrogeniformans]